MLVEAETGRAHVLVLAVSSPKEAVALVEDLDAERECKHPVERVPDTHPRAVLMGGGGSLGPEEAGLYGCLGFLTLDVPPDRQLACLRNVAEGTHDAPDPFGPLFHNSLWRGSLTPRGAGSCTWRRTAPPTRR